MKPLTQICLALAFVATLSACKGEEKHSVTYFSEHPDARSAQLAACELRDNADNDANCRNASEAARLAARTRDKNAFESAFGKASFD